MLSTDTLRTITRILSPMADAGAIRADELDEIKTRLSMKDNFEKPVPEYVTRKEVAKMFRVTTRTLDSQIVKTGKLRFFKPTGKRSVRFLKSDVEKCLMGN